MDRTASDPLTPVDPGVMGSLGRQKCSRDIGRGTPYSFAPADDDLGAGKPRIREDA